jgi:transposase
MTKPSHWGVGQHYSAEEKTRIALVCLRGEESIAALCRRKSTDERLYYFQSKKVLEAGKARLAGDTARQATAPAVEVTNHPSPD